ncbi:MAG: Ig-like domain-containing protein [Promethearchaeota archaeon]
MRRNSAFLLLLVLLLPLFTSIPPVITVFSASSTTLERPFSSSVISSSGDANSATPGPNLGIANWTSNRFGNPGLESWSSPTSPNKWSTWATGDYYNWYASAPWPVSEGSKSGGMQSRSPLGQYSVACWYQYNIYADMDNLTLTFDWYLYQNEDPSNDKFYLAIYLNDPGYGTRYMYYLLNGTTYWLNSSYQAVYKTYAPSQQWNVFSRNLTLDFISNPFFPSTIPANLELRTIYFYVRTYGGTDQYLRSFVDDVNLVNETNAHVWIGGSTRNGNWESIGSWTNTGNSDASLVSQSSMAHSGSWSANITATSYGNWSSSDLEYSPHVRITALNPGIISFWWYLNYRQATPNSRSVIIIGLSNGTQYYSIYYWLGYGVSPYSNSSSELSIHVDGFNTTNTWMYCERDIWADAAGYFNTNELYLDYFIFYVETYGKGSRVCTLIDDTIFRSGAINGAGFEDQRAAGSPVRGFGYYYTQYNELTITDTAYAGSKAANLTLTNNVYLYASQNLDWRPINGTRETYLDVMWRLEDYTPNSGNTAFFEVDFDNGHFLYYYLASYSGLLPSNTSQLGYFNVTGASTMNTWMQMHRDLAHDYEAVFGSLPDTDITYFDLSGYTSAGTRLELLLDDLYLYDDPAPRTSNVQRNPLAPDHYDAVQVSADAIDQDLDTVLLYYRLNSGTWQNMGMAYQSGDTFVATIPGQPHGTFVEYYVTANDTWGMTTTALDAGAYWSYTVWDQTDPNISSVGRNPVSPTYLDAVYVSADVTDAGSGIAIVVLFYRVDSGIYQQGEMNHTTGDTYVGLIPVHAWSSVVEYYINATDNAGNWKVDNNGGVLYSYTVGDTTNPIIAISTPVDHAEVSGTIEIIVTANDAGSGIAQVEFFIDSDSLEILSSPPYSYNWDTTRAINGNYTILVVAHDGAGNHASATITLTVNNPPPLIPGFPLEAIALALTVGVGFSLIRRRRHA